MTGKNNQITLKIVVNGTEVTVEANINEPFHVAAKQALKDSGTAETDLSRWELTTAAGDVLGLDEKIADTSVKNDDVLYLSLKAGAAG